MLRLRSRFFQLVAFRFQRLERNLNVSSHLANGALLGLMSTENKKEKKRNLA